MRTAPLCEHKSIWDFKGTTITEYTECAKDAVGRYQYEDPNGVEGEFDFCEDHIPDDAVLIEGYTGSGDRRTVDAEARNAGGRRE